MKREYTFKPSIDSSVSYQLTVFILIHTNFFAKKADIIYNVKNGFVNYNDNPHKKYPITIYGKECDDDITIHFTSLSARYNNTNLNLNQKSKNFELDVKTLDNVFQILNLKFNKNIILNNYYTSTADGYINSTFYPK